MIGARLIIDTPVPESQLVAIERFGEDILVPSACAECEVLTAKRATEAIGGLIVKDQIGFSEQVDRLSPPGKEDQIVSELRSRAVKATNGSCQFIVRQACWRLEEQE